MFEEMFLKIHLSACRIITQHTVLDVWNIFDVMHKQMSVSINLLFKLPVTNMALVNDSRTFGITGLHKFGQVLSPCIKNNITYLMDNDREFRKNIIGISSENMS